MNDNGVVIAHFSGHVHVHVHDSTLLQSHVVAGIAFGKPILGPAGSIVRPTEEAEFTPIPGCPSGGTMTVTGINAQNQISGYCQNRRYKPTYAAISAFVYADGQFTEIVEPTAIVTVATAINNHGVAAGWYQVRNTDIYRSFIYRGSSILQETWPPNANGNTPKYVRALGINDSGQLVGEVQGGSLNGFLAIPPPAH
jgi:hypothetical protein